MEKHKAGKLQCLEKLENGMHENINKAVSDVVKEVNESLGKILKCFFSSVEVLEDNIWNDLKEIDRQFKTTSDFPNKDGEIRSDNVVTHSQEGIIKIDTNLLTDAQLEGLKEILHQTASKDQRPGVKEEIEPEIIKEEFEGDEEDANIRFFRSPQAVPNNENLDDFAVDDDANVVEIEKLLDKSYEEAIPKPIPDKSSIADGSPKPPLNPKLWNSRIRDAMKGYRTMTYSPAQIKEGYITKPSEGFRTRNKSTDESLICDRCSYKTNCSSTLKKHISIIHENGKQYACDKCPYKSAYRKDLDNHVSAIHEKIRVKCDQCYFTTGYKSDLKKHIRRSHEEDADKMIGIPTLEKETLKCDVCPYSTTDNDAMETHRYVHEKLKEYTMVVTEDNQRFRQCKDCHYKTSKKSSFRKHVKTTHLKIRDHVCDQCGYAAPFKIGLTNHIKGVHMGISIKKTKGQRGRPRKIPKDQQETPAEENVQDEETMLTMNEAAN